MRIWNSNSYVMKYLSREIWIITWHLYLSIRVIQLYACKFGLIYPRNWGFKDYHISRKTPRGIKKLVQDLKALFINEDLKQQLWTMKIWAFLWYSLAALSLGLRLNISRTHCVVRQFLWFCRMQMWWIFSLVYEFGRGMRIFENIAGVRIRTLVYEKKKLCRARPSPREFFSLGRKITSVLGLYRCI